MESTTGVGAHTPSRAPSGEAIRVPELDLLRFIAATVVVFYHFTYRPIIHGTVDPTAFGPLQQVTRYGYMGVDLFFMISGFVILWSSEKRTAREFVISRVARLYPSYWICLLLAAFMLQATGVDQFSLGTILANLTMVPNLLGAPYVDGVYWTLFVELKFYVLVFVVLLFRGMKHVEKLLGLWLAASVICALGFAPPGLAALVMYPFGSYFISGCLIYLIRSSGFTTYRASLLGISAMLAVQHAVQQQLDFMNDKSPTTSVVCGLLVIVFHLLFVLIATRKLALPHSRWWYLLGSLTYPVYLLHNRVGKALWAQLPVEIPNVVALAILLAAVYGLSSIIAALVERRLCGRFQRAMTAWFTPSLRTRSGST